MDPVEEVDGMRGKSKLFHIKDGYFYCKSSVDTYRLYLKCVQASCDGRASIPAETQARTVNSLRLTRGHNHPPNEHFLTVVNLRRDILQRCAEDDVSSLRDIFDHACLGVPLEVSCELQYSQLKPSMYRARRANTPPIPQTLADVDALLREPLYERFAKSQSQDDFYRGSVSDPVGGVALIFASTHFLEHLPQCVELHIDGTFKVRPSIPPSRQLLTVMSMHYNHAFPVLFAVMERKNLQAYTMVFAFMRQIAPNCSPSVIITDFETTLQDAAERAFPEATIVGCWFHSSNAMRRRAKRLGLTNLLRDNPAAQRVVKMTMALPLLPANLIEPTFEEVRGYAVRSNLEQELGQYLEYIKRTWIDGVGSAFLSVFGQQRRTNNDQESYHRQLFLRIKQAHPNFWVFVDSVKKVEHSYRQLFLSFESGRPGPSYRRPAYIAQDMRITNASSMLSNGLYSPFEFLNLVSHAVPNADHGVAEEAEEEEDENDVGPPPNPPRQPELLQAPALPPAPARVGNRGRGGRQRQRLPRQNRRANGIVDVNEDGVPRGRGRARGRGRRAVRNAGRGRGQQQQQEEHIADLVDDPDDPAQVYMPASAPDQVPAPAPEQVPAPAPEQVPAPAPEQVPAPAPDQVPAPAPQQVPAPAPEQVPAPAPEQVPAPAPEQVPAPAPEQVPAPAPEQVPAPAPEQVPAPAPEQVPAPAPVPMQVVEDDIRDEEEIRRLGTCVACLWLPATHVVAPCGHICLCQPCAEELPRHVNDENPLRCPLCRRGAVIICRTFRSDL